MIEPDDDVTDQADPVSSDAASTPFSFRHLLLLDAVARSGRVSVAAKQHGISQSAATQALATLSERVGLAMLARVARGVTLTDAGGELHNRTGPLIGRLNQALRRIGVCDAEAVIWRILPSQLRLAEAVRDRGTLERACMISGISPRSAKRSLGGLERLLGLRILTRENGATVLNATGQLLIRHARQVADEIVYAIRDVRENTGRALQTLVIGVAPDPGTSSLNTAIKSFTKRHPDWCVEIIEADQADLLGRLVIGEVSIVLGHILGETNDLVAWDELAVTAYRVVARRNHPLQRLFSVSVDDLTRYPWLLGARGSQRRAGSDRLFAGRSQPACLLVTSAAPMMAQLIAESDAIALLSDHELALRTELLTPLRFETEPTLARLGVARRVDRELTQTHSEMIDLVQDAFRAA